jgi:hypothetical protein
MTDVEVTAVNRKPGSASHEHLTYLAGNTWRWTCQQVMQSIAAGTNTFYIMDHGRREEVAIASGVSGSCLRARVDGRWTDDLQALPDCRLHEGPAGAAVRRHPEPA